MPPPVVTSTFSEKLTVKSSACPAPYTPFAGTPTELTVGAIESTSTPAVLPTLLSVSTASLVAASLIVPPLIVMAESSVTPLASFCPPTTVYRKVSAEVPLPLRYCA